MKRKLAKQTRTYAVVILLSLSSLLYHIGNGNSQGELVLSLPFNQIKLNQKTQRTPSG